MTIQNNEVAVKHASEIGKLMFASVASYIKTYCNDKALEDMQSMQACCDDIALVTSALSKLAAFGYFDELHDDILQQDTLVREHFINVIRYIEQHNLVEKKWHVCE